MYQSKKSFCGMISLLAAMLLCFSLLTSAEEKPNNPVFCPLNSIHLNPDSIPFSPAVNYSAGDHPHSVFCADLDGDSDFDLAVANLVDDNVSILKNDGAGAFQIKVDYGAGDSPYFVSCADLDGDLDLDLAVANYLSGTVSILKNNGDGTFQSKVDYGAGEGPVYVFCADLDGDLDLDLAVANYSSDNVSIFKNNGNAIFQTKVDYGADKHTMCVFCGDLDGDLDLDLAVANKGTPGSIYGNVSILENNGNGTFQPKVDYVAGQYPTSISCADLDGDLDLDLAVADMSNNVSILMSNGDGSFQSEVKYGAGVHPFSIFCADLNGDLDLDLAVANADGDNVSIFENNGDGTFYAKVDYEAGDYPICVACADLDGDSDLDIAVANYREDNISVMLSRVVSIHLEDGESNDLAQRYLLSQNYPNPFNLYTNIGFNLIHSGFVSLKIYDVLGNRTKTLVEGNLSAGYKSISWDGRNDSGKQVASGIYFYRLIIGDYEESKKMVLLK